MTLERIARVAAVSILIIFGLLYLTVRLNVAFFQSIERLLFGWFGFLSRNLKAFALDPDIIFSGLIAGALSLVVLHFIARWLSAHWGIRWSFRSSASLFGFILILFATSFLVPGVIAISKVALLEPWTARSNSSVYYLHKSSLSQLQMSLFEYCFEAEGRAVPWDADSLLKTNKLLPRSPFDNGFTASGYLNLAAGLDPLEGKIPLFASPEFVYQGNTGRLVIFNDSTHDYVDAKQLGKLLEEVAQLHRAKDKTPSLEP